MKSIMAALIAMIAALLIPASVLAWHVEVGPSLGKARASLSDPAGDPFYSARAASMGAGMGYLEVPDEDWAQGTTFTVLGKSAGRGQRIYLKGGQCYEGTWSNWPEIEYECIPIGAEAVKVKFSWVGVDVDGQPKRKSETRWIPHGCYYQWGYRYVLPGTEVRVVRKKVKIDGQWVRATRILASEIADGPGWFGKIPPVEQGLVCP